MRRKTQNEKIIFGLKARKLRLERGLSFSDMKDLTNLSTSYLNEIEKGKKYPKKDKIKIIAKALNIPTKILTSSELPRSLAPIEDLLKSNFINELPLDIIGLDLARVVEMIAEAPSRVGAFVATLLDLSRNYALGEENFYFGALRAYMEMHNNYFKEIETEIEAFTKKYSPENETGVSGVILRQILEKKFGYKIEENGLKNYPELSGIRSLFLPEQKKLLLNENLSDTQKAFQFGKELGFNFLNLKERAFTANLLRVNSFEEVLNHFRAGYFASGLLINRQSFTKDLKAFFKKTEWDETAFLKLLKKYDVTPETFFQRMTNVVPEFLGVKNIFFLHSTHKPQNDKFRINRELHINRRHPAYSNGLNEHYCRRWLSYSLLKKFASEERKSNEILFDVQNAKFHTSGEEYFFLTVAKKSKSNQNVSVTLGILKDSQSEKNIKFLKDPKISFKEVNTTCERCPIQNCESRVAPATVIEKKEAMRKIKEVIDQISEENK